MDDIQQPQNAIYFPSNYCCRLLSLLLKCYPVTHLRTFTFRPVTSQIQPSPSWLLFTALSLHSTSIRDHASLALTSLFKKSSSMSSTPALVLGPCAQCDERLYEGPFVVVTKAGRMTTDTAAKVKNCAFQRWLPHLPSCELLLQNDRYSFLGRAVPHSLFDSET